MSTTKPWFLGFIICLAGWGTPPQLRPMPAALLNCGKAVYDSSLAFELLQDSTSGAFGEEGDGARMI